jgi:hypothetical protein
MSLEQYLQETGMTPGAAHEIAAAQRGLTPDAFEDWLAAHRYCVGAIQHFVEAWMERGEPQGSYQRIETEDPLTLRGDCVYVRTTDPAAGGRIFWVAAFPVRFAGEMLPTDDGQSVQPLAVIAAENERDSQRFRWLHLSPQAKAVFGAILEATQVAPGQWVQIREYDRRRGEQPPEPRAAGSINVHTTPQTKETP